MSRITRIGLVAVLALSALISMDYALAQTGTDVPFVINETQAGIVIGLGIGAGFLTAYQGYRTTNEDWDTLKFFDGVIEHTLGAIPLALAAAVSQTSFGLVEYAIIFFAAIGVGVQINYSRKKTVESNATK